MNENTKMYALLKYDTYSLYMYSCNFIEIKYICMLCSIRPLWCICCGNFDLYNVVIFNTEIYQ